MLRPRIIPCLLIHNGGLVKTVQFSDPKYVGDPINAVRIFNEKEADELIVLDIDATKFGREPNYQTIANLARECRMPLCYGGGITDPLQVEKIVGLGVEKVAISSAAMTDKELIKESSRRVGSQSVAVVMDVKKTGLFTKNYRIYTHNGRTVTDLDPVEFAQEAQNLGAGEIVINSIDRDGTLKGYDIELIDMIRESVTIPITAIGGAGSYNDFSDLIVRYNTIGIGAGSIFVFKGKYRAVLIQYPNSEEREVMFNHKSFNQ